MKICAKCQVEKDEEEFHKKGDKRHFCCKICQNAYTKEHYKNNKQAYLIKATKNRKKLADEKRLLLQKLKAAPCTDCNQSFPYFVMDFDHLRDKSCNVSEYRGSTRKLLKEIEKCELVCANCHRIRTQQRRKPQ